MSKDIPSIRFLQEIFKLQNPRQVALKRLTNIYKTFTMRLAIPIRFIAFILGFFQKSIGGFLKILI